MNAMQVADDHKPKTIGELRKYLDKLEAQWTEMDNQYLGKFEDQTLCCLGIGGGVARAYIQYWAEFGLVAVAINEK